MQSSGSCLPHTAVALNFGYSIHLIFRVHIGSCDVHLATRSDPSRRSNEIRLHHLSNGYVDILPLLQPLVIAEICAGVV
eukprot:scaffold19709_cov78-Skeletonema_dohrnii-CCMP3373.AAC.5